METSENIRFRELLQFMTMQVTDSLHAAAALRDGIEERERINSQIFPDLGIALLHCRSGAVTCTAAPARSGNPFSSAARPEATSISGIPISRESEQPC